MTHRSLLFSAPRFRRYLVGNTAASLGAVMLGTGVGWELYERTHSALALGYVGLVQIVPVVLLALPAGQWVDRGNRKRIVMGALVGQLAASLGLAGLAATHGPLGLVYVCLLLGGVAHAFYSPARSALLPGLVTGDELSLAITVSSSAAQLAYLLGPAIAGGLIALGHGALPVYLADAGAASVFLVALAGVAYAPPERLPQAPGWGEVMAGLRFVWRVDVILASITLDMFAVLLGGAVTLLPMFAKDRLAVGPQGLGWLLAAQSAGALLMGVYLTRRGPIQRNGAVLLWTVAGFGVATIAFGLSRNFALSWAMLCLVGAFDMVSMTIRQQLVQTLTPDAMRGRVAAVNGVFIGTSNELGGFESGLTAAWLGPVRSVVYGGLGTLAVVAFAAWRWPALRQLGPIRAPEPDGPQPT